MREILSPLSRILPIDSRDSFFTFTRTALSSTIFMNSSKPIITPSIRMSDRSKSQIWTTAFVCKCLKISVYKIYLVRLNVIGWLVGWWRIVKSG